MNKWLYYLLALMLHESFHLLSGKVLYGEGIRIRLAPAGFQGTWKSSRMEKKQRCVILIMGPIGNLLTALFLFFLPIDTKVRYELMKANLFIGLFNLIPFYPMDGGNILLIALYYYLGSNRTLGIMEKIGQWIRWVLLLIGFFMCVTNKNPSLLIAVTFAPGMQSMKRMVKRMNLNALIRRKERILKRRVYQVRHVLVLKEVSLGETLLLLDYDQFHIIHIADESMEIRRVITEQQFINAMLEENPGKTMEEVFLHSSYIS